GGGRPAGDAAQPGDEGAGAGRGGARGVPPAGAAVVLHGGAEADPGVADPDRLGGAAGRGGDPPGLLAGGPPGRGVQRGGPGGTEEREGDPGGGADAGGGEGVRGAGRGCVLLPVQRLRRGGWALKPIAKTRKDESAKRGAGSGVSELRENKRIRK